MHGCAAFSHEHTSAPPLALALAETAVQTVLLVAVVWGFTEGYRAVLHHTGQSLKRSEPLPTVLSLATWGFVGEFHMTGLCAFCGSFSYVRIAVRCSARACNLL
jgi:hypothetical protein